MDASIRISGGDEDREITGLWEWLRGERQLAGHVRAVPSTPAPGQLGGAVDVLTVALGSGGAGAVLARSLVAWLQSRRANVAVTVQTATRTVTVSAQNIDAGDALDILRQALPDDHA
jgi:hypothetical protein